MMISVPLGSSSSKDQIYATKEVLAQNNKNSVYSFIPYRNMCLSTYIANGIGRRQCTVHIADITLRGKNRETVFMINLLSVPYRSSNLVPSLKFSSMGSLEKSTFENGYQTAQCSSNFTPGHTANVKRQLRTLDSYFSKLKHSSCPSQSDHDSLLDRRKSEEDLSSERINTKDGDKAETGLCSLENYFDRLSDVDTKEKSLSNFPTDPFQRKSVRVPTRFTRERNEKKDILMEPYTFEEKINMDDGTDSLLYGDENSDLYLISLLAAINIAVFLFEIASPVRSELEHLSLPLIYGAKINELILLGEWWRLLTPMFLHSGFLHVALGCWVLLTYGPQVCKAYGPFTFFLIYVLGGICGNLTSFLHTPELTVCGTGPEFAILGAWLVFQVQNKEVASKETTSKSMLRKAVVATMLSFILGSFGRIDNWTHLGAVISGVIFGLLTCPGIAFDNATGKNGQKEGIALVHKQADPCKSFATFTFSILVLAALFFLYAPELQLLGWDDFS